MKKAILIITMLLLTFNTFASEDVILYKSNTGNEIKNHLSINNDDKVKPFKYVYTTTCGEVATSYLYEPVSPEQLRDWAEAMNEYDCG